MTMWTNKTGVRKTKKAATLIRATKIGPQGPLLNQKKMCTIAPIMNSDISIDILCPCKEQQRIYEAGLIRAMDFRRTTADGKS